MESVETAPVDIITIDPTGIFDALDPDISLSGSITSSGGVDVTANDEGYSLLFQGSIQSGNISGTKDGIYSCHGSYTGRCLTKEEAEEILDSLKY